MAQGLQYIPDTNAIHPRAFQSLAVSSIEEVGRLVLYPVNYAINRVFELFQLVNPFCNAINLKLQRSRSILQTSCGTGNDIWLSDKI